MHHTRHTRHTPPRGLSLTQPPSQRSEPLVLSLHTYTWLASYAPALCAKKDVRVEDVFSEEFQICRDMVSLLPPKIDRMHFLGEKGLSL